MGSILNTDNLGVFFLFGKFKHPTWLKRSLKPYGLGYCKKQKHGKDRNSLRIERLNRPIIFNGFKFLTP